MSEPASHPHLSLSDQMESALSDPEPMCLALVRVSGCRPVDGSNVSSIDPIAVLAAVEARLGGMLRTYDLMGRVAEAGFIVVFKTLADAAVMEARMATIHQHLAKPYEQDGIPFVANLTIGAAVRWPAEDAASLLQRADTALAAALHAGDHQPVLV